MSLTGDFPKSAASPDATILVVEDSDELRKSIQELLEIHGYSVLTASDGVEALEVLADRTPDLILLDVVMPRMDGWTFAREVRRRPSYDGIRIVAMTAHDVSESDVTKAGMQAFLAKGFFIDELMDLIREQLAHRTPPRPSSPR